MDALLDFLLPLESFALPMIFGLPLPLPTAGGGSTTYGRCWAQRLLSPVPRRGPLRVRALVSAGPTGDRCRVR